jgi:hypothetical protein
VSVASLREALRAFSPRAYRLLRLLAPRQRLIGRILRDRGQDSRMPIIQDGPFKGMRFLRQGTSSEELPMLLGCYEAELHRPLEAILARQPPVVVNVGCGEGYYAVGLARRLPGAVVYAFDSTPAARSLCARVADINDIGDHRMHIGQSVSPSDLARLPLDNGLVVCDCEGCEYSLLDPQIVPALQTCDLIVELHDPKDALEPVEMLRRFRSSHDIRLVPFVPRCPERERITAWLPRARDRALAAAERTMLDQHWVVMEARARHC